jgi:hypothetical protein
MIVELACSLLKLSSILLMTPLYPVALWEHGYIANNLTELDKQTSSSYISFIYLFIYLFIFRYSFVYCMNLFTYVYIYTVNNCGN